MCHGGRSIGSAAADQTGFGRRGADLLGERRVSKPGPPRRGGVIAPVVGVDAARGPVARLQKIAIKGCEPRHATDRDVVDGVVKRT